MFCRQWAWVSLFFSRRASDCFMWPVIHCQGFQNLHVPVQSGTTHSPTTATRITLSCVEVLQKLDALCHIHTCVLDESVTDMFIPHCWAAVLCHVLQGALRIGWQRRLRPNGAEQTHHGQSVMGSCPMALPLGLFGRWVVVWH